jgi:hypothetical protein
MFYLYSRLELGIYVQQIQTLVPVSTAALGVLEITPRFSDSLGITGHFLVILRAMSHPRKGYSLQSDKAKVHEVEPR